LIQLGQVNKENWVKCTQLSLKSEQESFLASNLATIAESKFEPHYQLRAIFSGEEIVGMAAFCPEIDIDEPDLYWIFRFMIDKSFQGKGLGHKALKLIIEEIKTLKAKKILTMCKPCNKVALSLYLKVGFLIKGYLDDGDHLLEYKCD
jgi:diamine N-acetyltransferase